MRKNKFDPETLQRWLAQAKRETIDIVCESANVAISLRNALYYVQANADPRTGLHGLRQPRAIRVELRGRRLTLRRAFAGANEVYNAIKARPSPTQIVLTKEQ